MHTDFWKRKLIEYNDRGVKMIQGNSNSRGFLPVEVNKRKDTELVIMPIRATSHSAGYDFLSPVGGVIKPNSTLTIWTNVKAYMMYDEVLTLHIRSSLGIKKGLILANSTGIIDSDYYSNPDNDGNIGICLYNRTNDDVIVNGGDAIAQGIFSKYLIADNCNTDFIRGGGIGSTGV